MRTPRSGPLVGALLSFLLVMLVAGSASAAGWLQGKVVTRNDGPTRPVAGAEVHVEILPGGQAASYAPASTTVVITDERGRFKIDRMVVDGRDGVRTEPLPEGATLRLRIQADGLPTLRREVVYRGGKQKLTLVLEQPPILIARVLGQDERGMEIALQDVRVFLTPLASGEPGDDPLAGMHAVGITDGDGVTLFDHVYPKALDRDSSRVSALVVGRPYVLEVRAPEYYVLRGTAELRAGVQGMELVLVPKSSTQVDDTSGVIREADKLLEAGSVRRNN